MATCAAGSPALGEHEGRFAARAEVPPRQGGAVGPGVTAPRRQRGKSARRLRSVGLGREHGGIAAGLSDEIGGHALLIVKQGLEQMMGVTC